ncbi:hypothetical protein GGX14DRAFT_586074 [Mycena pura]|uniref:Uncharacterized protein n=1 Tax=Mycena pura TaxID=153505 RepID=A0AAD6VRY9_9AGAR|nr:hypothetical protein GGX14DRAFT_586074 [Mycena pura]
MMNLKQRKDTGERSQNNMHSVSRSTVTMPSENGQRQTGNPVASAIAPPAQQLVDRVKCTPCLFCGHRLPVPPAQRAALDKFLSQAYGMEELGEGLACAGVATDCAFSALVRLSRRQRDEFLRGLNMTPLLRTILMNLFDEYIDRMKMKTSTGCRGIVEHSGTAAGMPEEPNGAHRCPLRPVCKPKIPPVLDALLRAHEMEDLGPAFLALGFRSDDHVKRILVSQAMQAELLAEENLTRLHVHLTDFQKMMMRYILAEA